MTCLEALVGQTAADQAMHRGRSTHLRYRLGEVNDHLVSEATTQEMQIIA